MYRQGDVLIEKIDNIPVRPSTTNRLLVMGEGKNHGHYISGECVSIYEALKDEMTKSGGIISQYLEILGDAVLDHKLIDTEYWTEEHAPIRLPPGKYRVVRQREYNPYARAIRAVRD